MHYLCFIVSVFYLGQKELQIFIKNRSPYLTTLSTCIGIDIPVYTSALFYRFYVLFCFCCILLQMNPKTMGTIERQRQTDPEIFHKKDNGKATRVILIWES